MRDVLTGAITLRRFRVLVEHLPPGNVLERARSGGWSELEALLWNIESRLRDLTVLTANINRKKDTPAIEVPYLPTPQTPEERDRAEAQAAYDAAMQAELESLW